MKPPASSGLTQSKVQYQAMMVQLFIQRRFQHVVMSARFYNIIYRDGDQAMRIKKAQTPKNSSLRGSASTQPSPPRCRSQRSHSQVSNTHQRLRK
ncbi:hypothetical protein [Rubritalea tangerina]|uniref:hypothetical protein n=1 Tax=Rubritalea tangerina TaxID=430798 RepID=UPI00360828C5